MLGFLFIYIVASFLYHYLASLRRTLLRFIHFAANNQILKFLTSVRVPTNNLEYVVLGKFKLLSRSGLAF
jgi:hypothetical protein